MNVLFRSDAGPLEGFTSASFRVAVSDDGIGVVTALPDVVDSIVGTVVCSVDGVDVFAWRVEDREAIAQEVEEVNASGRGGSAAFERAVVLPAGYPTFTERTRTITAAPFAVWSQLLAEAQGRGRLTGVTPTWTATEDSKGDPWQTNVTVQLDPGTNLRQLLEEVAEVEGAEWFVNPDLTVDAAPQLGTDRSSEVVLFVGRDQLSRGRRQSSRRQRETVFLEASTGVSEVSNPGVDPDAGEIWLEAQDFADPITRPVVAARVAESLAEPDVEVEVSVAPDCGIFDTFNVGDLVGLDDGTGTITSVRVVGAFVQVAETIEVELTLISEVALRQKQLERAIEAKADVQLAASTSFQRRHGLVTADKFLSGAVGTDVAIASENYVPAIPGPGEGWAIFGNGNAEFNEAIFRGDLQSDNYVPDVSGWKLSRDGDAEFANIDLREKITFETTVTDAGKSLTVGMFHEGTGIEFDYLEPTSAFAGGVFLNAAPDGFTVPPPASRGMLLWRSSNQHIFVGEGAVDIRSLNGDVRVFPSDDEGQLNVSGDLVTQARFLAVGSAFLNSNLTVDGNAFLDAAVTVEGVTLLNGGAGVAGGLTVQAGGFNVQADGASITGGMNITSNGANIAGGVDITSNGLDVVGSTRLRDFTRVSATLRVDGTLDLRGFVDFATIGTTRFRYNDAGQGSQGGEPTFDTTQNDFGFIGIPSRRIFRGYAGAWLTGSDGKDKGEVVSANLEECYDKVKAMELHRYSRNKDRDDYYTAKGEAFLAGEDFGGAGHPRRVLGIMAEDAPDEVADEGHVNIDVYAYASLIAGAVKHLQDKVERLESARAND